MSEALERPISACKCRPLCRRLLSNDPLLDYKDRPITTKDSPKQSHHISHVSCAFTRVWARFDAPMERFLPRGGTGTFARAAILLREWKGSLKWSDKPLDGKMEETIWLADRGDAQIQPVAVDAIWEIDVLKKSERR